MCDAKTVIETLASGIFATPSIVLIRGLPGSGKTTMAKLMTGHTHCEADMFFVDATGQYQYDSTRVAQAHEWCREKVRQALLRYENVVVSNTFSRLREMEPYLAIAKEFGIVPQVIEATGKWKNVHDVPEERIEQMRQRWEVLAPPEKRHPSSPRAR